MENSNVVPIAAPSGSNDDWRAQLVLDLKVKIAKGEDIDPYEIITNLVDVSEKNTELEKLFVESGLMTSSEFKRTVRAKRHTDEVIASLGFFPKTPKEFVSKFADRERYRVFCNGEMDVENFVAEVAGMVMTDKDKEDRDLRGLYEHMKASERVDTEQFARMLRMERDELGLRFKDSAISDAVGEWFDRKKKERRVDLLGWVSFGQSTRMARDMWEKVHQAAFSESTHPAGYPAAVIQKHIWQIKRKGRGLPVTNHLMMVLTGLTGGGKSVFIRQMHAPIQDAFKEVTFDEIQDKTMYRIWESFVLFLDEMSRIANADRNLVKQRITQEFITMRPPYARLDIQVKQQATLCGCANDSLSEIMTDSTSARRFVELEYNSTPDFELVNSIDWLMLWRSVDEEGPDPMLPFMDVLKLAQEEIRVQTPVERWAREQGPKFTEWTKTVDLWAYYKLWLEHDTSNDRKVMNTDMFGKELCKLIKHRKDFLWVRSRTSKGNGFRFAS